MYKKTDSEKSETMSRKNERMFEIFLRALHGEHFTLGTLANEYGISKKSVSRDINYIREFLINHRELVNNAELIYSHSEQSYCLNSNEFLKNKELFAIIKVILGCRCFKKEDLLNLITKLKRFTTMQDRTKFNMIIRKEVYHYNEVKSDCNSVIDNLWKIIQAIDNKNMLTISYYKMNRDEVKRKIKPISVMFSEYYFYLIAYMAEDEKYKPKFFRVDRITSMIIHRECFQLEKKYDFDEGNLREKNQFMFPGETDKIRFAFSGLSVQAILDRLPTAKIVDKQGNTHIIEAEVNIGRGIVMYLLSQGAWVKVLSPQSLVDEIKAETEKILSMYK